MIAGGLFMVGLICLGGMLVVTLAVSHPIALIVIAILAFAAWSFTL